MDHDIANKLLIGLGNNFNNLSMNLTRVGGQIQGSGDRMDQAINRLQETISDAAKSSDRQANAMKWLTFALVVVGLLQIFLPVITKYFQS